MSNAETHGHQPEFSEPIQKDWAGLQGGKMGRLQRPGLRLAGSKPPAQLTHGPPPAEATGRGLGGGDLSGFAALVRLLFTQQNYGTEVKKESGRWVQMLGSGPQLGNSI